MSAKTNNDSNRTDIDFSALDRELAQMAEETPEVPADFHAKWVSAIREEAAQRETEPPVTGQAKETRKTSFLRQRRYLLSAAAAFVILIGGVIAYTQTQPGKRGETAPAAAIPATDTSGPEGSKADAADASATAMEEAGETNGAAEYSMAAEAEPFYETETAAEEPAYGVNMAAEAGYDAYAKAAGNDGSSVLSAAMPDSAGESAYAPAAGTAMKAGVSREEAAAESFADMEEAEEAGEAFILTAEYAEEAEAAEEPLPAAMTPAASAAPTPAAAAPPTETQAPAAAEETEPAAEETLKEPETEMESRSFLQSVWTFILTITPWLLGATIIILFIFAYVINIEKRRERKNK